MFKKQHRIRIFKGAKQKSFGICRRGRVDHLEARYVEKPRFCGLAVERSGPHVSARRHADDYVGLLAPAPVDFGEVVDDLVEADRDEVAELHLHHGFLAGNAQAQGRANNGRFAQWRVAHAFFAKSLHKSVRHFEHAPVLGDVLPHEHKLWKSLHGLPHAFTDGVDQPQIPNAFRRQLGFGGPLGCWHWRKPVPQFRFEVR